MCSSVLAATRGALVLFLMAAGQSACVINVDSAAFTAREEKHYTVGRAPEITLNTFDGPIEVRSWDRSEVSIEIEKRAPSDAELKQIDVRADQAGDRIVVEVRGREGRRHLMNFGSPSAKIVASVPRASNLILKSGDGSVKVERIDGRLEVDTTDGSITVRDGKGDIRARTGDGSIRLENVNGRVDIDTRDGGIRVDGVLQAVKLRTGDGSVVVRADSASGMVDDWDIRTGDGGVELELPQAFDAELDAHTGDGSIRLEGLTVPDVEKNGRAARGKIGAGGRKLRLETGDGSIVIRK